ncbi:hypothetical protein Nepgr_028738 [Nepenthes gracilis]|uniref:Transmembrane protein n=1 Tax=Nepenthes gracilis TaxID=150966 RepID=A0AAD3Y482_NEPGR|nr:hypothetical protein Nepgr_028738 [Nepenthes gracilis]
MIISARLKVACCIFGLAGSVGDFLFWICSAAGNLYWSWRLGFTAFALILADVGFLWRLDCSSCCCCYILDFAGMVEGFLCCECCLLVMYLPWICYGVLIVWQLAGSGCCISTDACTSQAWIEMLCRRDYIGLFLLPRFSAWFFWMACWSWNLAMPRWSCWASVFRLLRFGVAGSVGMDFHSLLEAAEMLLMLESICYADG